MIVLNIFMDENKDYMKNNSFDGLCTLCTQDKDEIYIYDFLSEGIYRIDCDRREVGIVIAPDILFEKKIYDIKSIVKTGGKIYLIPSNIQDGVTTYCFKDNIFDNKSIVNIDMEVGESVSIGQDGFIIVPFWSDDPLVFFSNGEAFVNKKWCVGYDQNIRTQCWGGCRYEDEMIIPLQKTNYFVRTNEKGETKICQCDKEVKIHLITKNDDGIWILPWAENKVYLADENGHIKDELHILEYDGTLNSAGDFARMISVGHITVILSGKGRKVFVSQGKKDFYPVKQGGRCKHFSNDIIQYSLAFWGYAITDKKICILPYKYRYAEIDLQTAEMSFMELYHDTSFTDEDYNRWKKQVYKKNNFFYENDLLSINDFLKHIGGQ